MAWFGSREHPLFRTHEAPSRKPDWAVGELVEHEGAFYRVTRWVELRPVPLERGGSVGEWEIWGRKVSSKELRKELLGAADRMLEED